MSTYVISDIHGALPQFQKLLKKIKFAPVMHLDRSSDRVHCLRLEDAEEFYVR